MPIPDIPLGTALVGGKGVDVIGQLIQGIFGSGRGRRRQAETDIEQALAGLFSQAGEDVIDPFQALQTVQTGLRPQRKRAAELVAEKNIGSSITEPLAFGELQAIEAEQFMPLFAQLFTQNAFAVSRKKQRAGELGLQTALQRLSEFQ